MLDGQAEGSMVGFKLNFKQESVLTLRVWTSDPATASSDLAPIH